MGHGEALLDEASAQPSAEVRPGRKAATKRKRKSTNATCSDHLPPALKPAVEADCSGFHLWWARRMHHRASACCLLLSPSRCGACVAMVAGRCTWHSCFSSSSSSPPSCLAL